MNHFTYRHGILHAENVDLASLAREVGTPFYCYSTATLERHYRVFAQSLPADALIAFSVKANGNLAVLRTLGRLGAGADVVSVGELKKALAAGIKPERIVFSGVGKTGEEMRLALEVGIHQFNVESEAELEVLNQVALTMRRRAPVALRVNPDIDARTHAKIATGGAETKFGIPWGRAEAVYAQAALLKVSRLSASTCISEARLPILNPLNRHFAAWANWLRACRQRVIPSRVWIWVAVLASLIAAIMLRRPIPAPMVRWWRASPKT
jgi:diaminopimelate decarboxylase